MAAGGLLAAPAAPPPRPRPRLLLPEQLSLLPQLRGHHPQLVGSWLASVGEAGEAALSPTFQEDFADALAPVLMAVRAAGVANMPDPSTAAQLTEELVSAALHERTRPDGDAALQTQTQPPPQPQPQLPGSPSLAGPDLTPPSDETTPPDAAAADVAAKARKRSRAQGPGDAEDDDGRPRATPPPPPQPQPQPQVLAPPPAHATPAQLAAVAALAPTRQARRWLDPVASGLPASFLGYQQGSSKHWIGEGGERYQTLREARKGAAEGGAATGGE